MRRINKKGEFKGISFPKVRSEMSTQEKILFLVKNRKATTLTEIANILGKTKSTISEHLDKLSAERKIHLHKRGKENRIYLGKLKSSLVKVSGAKRQKSSGGFKGASKKRKK